MWNWLVYLVAFLMVVTGAFMWGGDWPIVAGLLVGLGLGVSRASGTLYVYEND